MTASNPFEPRQSVLSLRPYQPGLSNEAIAAKYGIEPDQIIKLASNENPLGPSPLAIDAVKSVLASAERYPDGEELRAKIAKFYALQPNQVTLGNGSNDVLDLIARVFLHPNTNAVSSQYGFTVYQLVTQLAGAENIVVKAKDFGHDLPAMLAAINERTKVVWIANPNNPTGTFVSYDIVRQFMADCPRDVVVVLDEAYYEYLDDSLQIDSTTWLADFPNLVIVRTFSKMYGLAGMRVGYALASPEISDLLNRVRQPFNVSSLALAAAIAALDDTQHIERTKALNKVGLAYLEQQLKILQLEHIPSYGNFITVRVPGALEVFEQLLQNGIIVRPLVPYGMQDHLRISIGTETENERLVSVLEKILQ